MKQSYCKEDVQDPFGVRFHKCGKTAKFDPDANGVFTRCGIHSSAAIARREAVRAASMEKYDRRRSKAEAIHNATARLEPTLRKIAEGANDPRSLAAEVVAALDAARAME